MMRPSNDIEYVWLARDPVDFRKGINGLSIVVEEQLAHDPFSGHLFVFINKARDKIKALYWCQRHLQTDPLIGRSAL